MTTRLIETASYAEQLSRLAGALTLATRPTGEVEFAGDLSRQLRLFAEENGDKRRLQLQRHLEFVAQAFNDFDGLLSEYIRSRPHAAYASIALDAEQFFGWLQATHDLTSEQLDHVRCQSARHAVEAAARQNRRGHVRFQELWSVAPQLAGDLVANADLSVHLNPIRAWTRFLTPALLDEDARLPADVLFFAVGNEISTAVLEPEGQNRLDELASFCPCTLDSWSSQRATADREELAPFCLDLAEMGLVAFA